MHKFLIVMRICGIFVTVKLVSHRACIPLATESNGNSSDSVFIIISLKLIAKKSESVS